MAADAVLCLLFGLAPQSAVENAHTDTARQQAQCDVLLAILCSKETSAHFVPKTSYYILVTNCAGLFLVVKLGWSCTHLAHRVFGRVYFFPFEIQLPNWLFRLHT